VSRPTTTEVRIARSPKTVADQVVLGLVTGGLLGPGLVIQQREAQCVRFSSLGTLPGMPNRGEIELIEEDSGGTRLECRFWCHGMSYRRLVQAVCLGALIATITALAFGWLIHLSIPLGVGVGVAWDLVGGYRDRSSLRRRVEAFARNTTYLKTM